MLQLSNSFNLVRYAKTISACSLALLCAIGLMLTVNATTQAQNSGQGSQPSPRRPLPKPTGGARGFEQSAGHDTSSRLTAAGATRGSANIKAIAPMEGLAYDSRPFFKWTAISGAKTYRFVLREANTTSSPIVFQADSATPQLLYPATAPALVPGKLYTWRVSTAGTLERKVGSPVAFFILTGEDAMEVRSALEKAKLAAPQTTAEHINQAQIFEQYGVWYDALRIASEAVNANPQDTAAKAYYEALLKRLSDAEKAMEESDSK